MVAMPSTGLHTPKTGTHSSTPRPLQPSPDTMTPTSIEAQSLATELQSRLAQFRQQAPAEAIALIDSANAQLEQSGLLKRALQAGDAAPQFTLPDHLGRPFDLKAALAQGPVILSFYRGGWCPYCNLELRAYERVLDQIVAAGAQLVAISPETPDRAEKTSIANALRFPVLSDTRLVVAQQFGIVFDLAQGLRELYTRFGHALPQVNGDDSWALPAPATFVIDRSGRIVLASVDADYRRRLEPADAIAALRGL